MLKKIIFVILILLIALGVLIGVYYSVQKAVQIITGPEISRPETTNIPPNKLKTISDEPVFDYWITNIQATPTSTPISDIYYLTKEGQIWKGKEDADEAISSQSIDNLQSITPSRDGSLAIIKFGNVINPQFSILNIQEKSWQPLPMNVRAVGLSPDKKQLALLVATDGKNDLIIQDLNPPPPTKKVPNPKPGSRKLLSLYQKGLEIKWLTPEKLILSENPTNLYASSMWSVDVKSSKISSLVSDVAGLTVQWKEDGSLGLKYALNEQNLPSLAVVNNNGAVLDNLNFITLPDKCTFTDTYVYCGVPSNISQKDLLDQYLKGAVYFEDALMLFTKSSDQNYHLTDVIDLGNKSVDVLHPRKKDNSLFFINRLDGKLYKLSLE